MSYKIKILIRIADKDIEHGYLLKQMPQGDKPDLYEAIGNSGKFYILKQNEFVDLGWVVEAMHNSYE
jgi:hypothetical protein